MADYNGTNVPAFSPVLSQDFNAEFDGLTVNLPPPTSYAQRVWSSGTSVWCYYVGQLTSSPIATQTTPNWVGSAIRHQVLGSV